MSPNNHNSHSHNDQESNQFVNSNRTFYNSVQKFIKKVKNTFKNQETYKIDNHINSIKKSKKSHVADFQDKAFNFLKDVWIFFCKAASFIIKASFTLFDIVKPHATKAFNKTKTFFKKAHEVLIQNENGILHFNKEKQEQSSFRIAGVVCSAIAVTTFALFAYGAFKAANTKIPLSEGYALLFVIACLSIAFASVFLEHSKENSMKVTAEVNINTSDELVTKILLNKIDELHIENNSLSALNLKNSQTAAKSHDKNLELLEENNFQKAVTESLLTEHSRLTSENQRLQDKINSNSYCIAGAFILGAAVAQNPAILNRNF